MPAVFAGGQTHNGGFRADQLTLSFGGTDVRGMLVQNVNFTYQQQVALLYEVGSNYVYYVGGRAQGTAALGRIVGPAPLGRMLISKFNDLCSPQDIQLRARAGCRAAMVSYNLHDAVLVNIAVAVQAQDVVINENLQFMFINLDYDGAPGQTGIANADSLALDPGGQGGISVTDITGGGFGPSLPTGDPFQTGISDGGFGLGGPLFQGAIDR